ncbi:MAG TPA: TonB-dependent receptor [Caulobacteraceae bacterium]
MSKFAHAGRRALQAGASLAAIAFALAAAPANAQTPSPEPTPLPGGERGTSEVEQTPVDDSATPGNDAAPQEAGAPADAGDVEGVVVTGFRRSLQSAIAAKRQETDVVDVIKAEDIADFPDLNLAESIQRIPGVSIDRDAGEGRSITVRGLGSDFTRTRINGLEALATTGGTDSSGGANRGRGFDFNVFASELFNSITVRKTQAAEVEEGSLGATVDLQTSRPFDYKGFVMAVSGQMGFNDLSEQWDPRGAFLISNRWFDGRLGALFSVAYTERNLLEEGFSSVRWDNGPSSGGFCSPVGVTPQNPANSGATGSTAANCATGIPRPANTAGNVTAYQTASAATTFHPRLPRYGRLTHEQERLGITGSIQFRPVDSTLLTLDLLYADLSSTRQEDFLETISFSRTAAQGGVTQTHVLQAEVDAQGDLVYGVFDNVDARSESRFAALSTEFRQATFSLEHEFSDRLRANLLVGRSESIFRNPLQTTVTFDIQNVDGYSWDFRPNDRLPVITYPFDVTSPTAWQWISSPAANSTGSEIRIRPQGADNVFTTWRADAEYDLTDAFTFKAGVVGKKFEFDTFELRRANEASVPALPSGVTLAQISQVLTGFGRGLDLPPGVATSWLTPDLNTIASLFNIYCNCNTGVPGGDFTLTGVTNGNARGNNRSVVEDDLSVYAQTDFRTTLLNRRLRGNLGVRWVQTQIEARGFLATGGGTEVVVENEYTDTLPSLNLAWDVTDEFIVRAGAAKVMARPQLPNLSPGGTVATTGNLTITTGNPLLEPFRATTYDLSFEWYFAPESLLSLGLFYKDINTYIQTLRETRPYNTTGLPLSLLPPNFTGEELFAITTPVNTEGGPLKGFEVSYQQPFTFLTERFGMPGWVGNFGTILNYTHVQSEIEYAISPTSGTFVTANLVNLSPNAYNATLYYEDQRFSARVSASSRESYLQTVPGRNNNDVEGKLETFNVDAAASYNLRPNVTLTFEAINLTDEVNDQFVDSRRNSSSVYHHTGRQFYFGFRYKH